MSRWDEEEFESEATFITWCLVGLMALIPLWHHARELFWLIVVSVGIVVGLGIAIGAWFAVRELIRRTLVVIFYGREKSGRDFKEGL